MKLLISILMTIGLYAAPSGVYIESNIGTGLSKNILINDEDYKYNIGVLGSLALGYQLDLWRFELEGNYKQNELTILIADNTLPLSGYLVRKSGIFNVYYSGYNKSKLVSTVGLGCGASYISTRDLKKSNNNDSISANNIFTYQASYSIGYIINKDITFSVKYLYFNTLKYDIDDVSQKEIHDNIFTFGIRYLF